MDWQSLRNEASFVTWLINCRFHQSRFINYHCKMPW